MDTITLEPFGQIMKDWKDGRMASVLNWAGFGLRALGRLCRAQGKEEEAGEHFRIAKELIEEMGYFRREKELLIINY